MTETLANGYAYGSIQIWQGLDGFQKSLCPCSLDSALALEGLNLHKKQPGVYN